MVSQSATLSLSGFVVGWVTVVVLTCEGDRRCKIPLYQRDLGAMWCACAGTTLARFAAGFASWRVPCALAVVGLLVLHDADRDYVLPDGILEECERIAAAGPFSQTVWPRRMLL
ncbi:hypothetical protein [Streptomyces chartreusis]|uniref:hypothetical protein n=1 Tax=Streptomyces chartreusis TaxID=1969 RepID=UPI0034087397